MLTKKAKKTTLPTGEDVLITSPLGPLKITSQNNLITHVEFHPKVSSPNKSHSSLRKQLQAEFDRYFANPTAQFNLQAQLKGTPFQIRVWESLLKILPGQVLTYGQLAQNLNSSPRAVGGALRANPCPILYPCHRVVAKSGLGGFSGQTVGPKLSIKAWLLKHEGLSF